MIIPVGFGQANFLFTGNGYPRGAQVTLGFKNNDDVSVTACAAQIRDDWVSDIMVLLSSNINFAQIKVKLGPEDTGDEVTLGVAVAGTITATQPFPPQDAGLIKKLTASGGRKNKGKMFLPGLSEGDSDGAGRLTATAQGNLQTAFDSLLSDLIAAELPPYILHTDALDAPTEITGFSVEQLMATQRRRIRRTGGRRPVGP